MERWKLNGRQEKEKKIDRKEGETERKHKANWERKT